MDTSALEDLGLSNGESKVYIVLLGLGESKVGAVIEKSSLVSSVVHTDIHKLVEKGLVSYVKKGKIKYYRALPPQQMLHFLREKEKRFLEILPSLENKRKLAQEKEDAEVFQGMKGISAMLDFIIKSAKKREEYFFFSTDLEGMNKEIQEFWATSDAKRKEKGLIVKGLARPELKSLYIKRKTLMMRYTSMPLLSSVTICNGQIAMVIFGERPVGYLITSRQMFEAYKRFFEKIWTIAKE